MTWRLLAACSCLMAAIASMVGILECQPDASTATSSNAVAVPCISVSATAAGQTVPTGTVWNVTASAVQLEPATSCSGTSVAGTPIDGLPLTFGVAAAGATVSPTSNVTDGHGLATVSVVVPFDTEVAVTVSGGGGETVGLVPPAGSTTPPPSVSLTVQSFETTSTWLPGGELFELAVSVTSPPGSDNGVPGFSVSFATTTTGVSFSPPTVVTDETGVARSYVIIPYGAQIQAVYSGGGLVKEQPASALPLTLTAQPLTPTNTAVAGGDVYTLTVQATPADGAGGAAIGVPGVSLSFATTTSGVSFSPASVNTNASGFASSSVIVPYGTQLEAVVSGAGNVTTYPARDAGTGITAPVAILSTVSFVATQPPLYLPGGQQFAFTVQANVQTPTGLGPAVEGLSVTFASTTGATFSPASVPTNSLGQATSNVVVPYGSPIVAIVSGGGAVSNLDAGQAMGPVVTLDAALTLTDAAPLVDAAIPCTFSATAQVGNTPIVGLPLTIAVTDIQSIGSSGAIAGPASPVLTGDAGGISYAFLIPPNVYHFTAVVSGGGAAATASY